MLQYFFGFLCIIAIMLLLDTVWLGWIAKSYYKKSLRPAITFEVHGWAAVCFYILHALGTLFFVVHACQTLQETILLVMMRGLFFGVVTYGTYDLTNLATVKKWPVALSFLDIAWGGFITMLSGTTSHLLVRWLS
jgi:uncharacterized membrane protein